jgi:hypothetical protein
VAHGRTAPLLDGTRLLTAATFLGYINAAALPMRVWTGILLYGGVGVALVAAPLMSRLLHSIEGTSLRSRLALALCAAATLPLVVAISVFTQVEEATVRAEYWWRTRHSPRHWCEASRMT